MIVETLVVLRRIMMERRCIIYKWFQNRKGDYALKSPANANANVNATKPHTIRSWRLKASSYTFGAAGLQPTHRIDDKDIKHTRRHLSYWSHIEYLDV
jgi:hypothetical protein